MNTCLTHDIDTGNGRFIRAYDNVFEQWFKAFLYQFAKNSAFRIGWSDSQAIERGTHRSLLSSYSDEDIQNLGILEYLRQTPLASELIGYTIAKAILNLSTPADSNFSHVHHEDKILLVYVNEDWQDGWHGETLFYSPDKKEIAFASPYSPNRVIAFDPKIPHAIRPQSSIAPFYRFTLALIFTKDELEPAPQGG